jgi:hypothetical protein
MKRRCIIPLPKIIIYTLCQKCRSYYYAGTTNSIMMREHLKMVLTAILGHKSKANTICVGLTVAGSHFRPRILGWTIFDDVLEGFLIRTTHSSPSPPSAYSSWYRLQFLERQATQLQQQQGKARRLSSTCCVRREGKWHIKAVELLEQIQRIHEY